MLLLQFDLAVLESVGSGRAPTGGRTEGRGDEAGEVGAVRSKVQSKGGAEKRLSGGDDPGAVGSEIRLQSVQCRSILEETRSNFS